MQLVGLGKLPAAHIVHVLLLLPEQGFLFAEVFLELFLNFGVVIDKLSPVLGHLLDVGVVKVVEGFGVPSEIFAGVVGDIIEG